MSGNSQKGKGCWICNGPHLSRDCPDRQHPHYTKGKSKGKFGYAAEFSPWDYQAYDDFYMGRSKGKKGKSHHWLESQAWLKGKGPRHAGSGKGPLRPPVNAYHSELFVGGLEMLRSPNELQASTKESLPSTHGLLDCGATASAGPQIAVEKLISAVLSKDSQAQIDIRQGDRPYFRFGNGRWGRALYKVEINSCVSGQTRKFGLYALPNPAELHSPDFDMNSLVPILIGMDHLSSPSSAMTIDFMTGLALDSHEIEPMVYQLASNRKGHFVLDIVYFLTRGHTNFSGHPRVHVMEAATTQHEENHFIQFMPLEFDAHIQEAHDSQHIYRSEKLQKSHRNLLKLHGNTLRFCASQQSSAHMIASTVTPNSSPPDPPCNGAAEVLDQITGGEADRDSAINARESLATTLRRGKESGSRSSRPQNASSSVAVLRQPSSSETKGQSLWTVDTVPCMQSQVGVHAPSGSDGSSNKSGERAPSDPYVAGAGDYAGRSPTICGTLPGYAEESGRGDSVGDHGGQAPFKLEGQTFQHTVQGQGEDQGLSGVNLNCDTYAHGGGAGGDGQLGTRPPQLPDCRGDGSRANFGGKSSGGDQHGVRRDEPRGGASGGGGRVGRALSSSSLRTSTTSKRVRFNDGDGSTSSTRPMASKRSSMTSPPTITSTSSSSTSTSSSSSTPLTRSMAAKVLLMATTLLTSMASAASDLLLGGNDGAWEIACAPHSWLTEACLQQGLRPRRINLHQGFDVYKDKTWAHLRELRRQHKPKRLWFSLRCTMWCQWTYINYSTPEKKILLAAYRRKEIRMLWNAVHFIENTLKEDPDIDIYWEWPWPCIGWGQGPLLRLQQVLHAHGREWLPCRIDGCNYGLRANDGAGDFLRKQWMVRTTSSTFHQKFKTKTCPGGHRHSHVAGVETAKSSYYPWRMVKAIANAWRQELLSDRNQRLLFAVDDQPSMVSIEEELNVLEEGDGNLFPVQQPLGSVEPSPDELEQWKTRVSHFHKAAGHPTNRNLARVIKDSGAPDWKVRVALEHSCETCKSLKAGSLSSGQVPPAATHALPKAWQVIGLDAFEWTVPGLKKKARFLLIIDLATKLRSAVLIRTYPDNTMHGESSEEVIQALVSGWLAHYPKPEIIIPDNASSFASAYFHEFVLAQGIRLHFPPEKEPWSHGIVEAAGKDVKHVATAIQTESLDNTPEMTLALACSALNSTEYTAGFSAHQWAFGSHYSISDEDVRLWQAVDPSKEFVNVAKARQDAEEIARQSRAKRVLSKLSNTTVRQPLRKFSITDLVMVWRRVQTGEHHQGNRGGLKKSSRPHWAGPGRVVFAEAIPHQEGDDTREHIIWVLMGRKLWRCSVHSVRPVNETERLQHELFEKNDPTQWRTLADMLPQKEFIDVTAEIPSPDELEIPDLPTAPDATTYAPIRRARGKQTLADADYRQVHRSSPLGLRQDVPAPHHFVPPATGSASQPSVIAPATSSATSQPRAMPSVIAPATSSATSQASAIAPATSAGASLPVNDYGAGGETAEMVDDSPPLTASEAKKQKLEFYDLKWVETLEQEAPHEITEHDVLSCLQSYDGECLCFELDLDFSSHRQQKNFQRDPVLYLVRKLNSSEVSLKNLTPAERELFARAKGKEVNSFLKNAAVRKCIDDKEVSEAFGSGRILKARWVLTWKNVAPDERHDALKDLSENKNTVVNADATKKAKARIVLLGFQHPSLLDRNFKTSAPVISSLGKNLIYTASTLHQWELHGLDLATAFLQTMPTEADDKLYTTGVPELCEALQAPPDSVSRILRNIYGSTTAPRGLWLSLNKTLCELGGVPTLGERCLWCWYSKHERAHLDMDHVSSV